MTAVAGAKPSGLDSKQSTGAPVGHDPRHPERDNKVNRMGSASIPCLLLEFAVPAILGMLVNGAYNLIDRVFLGQAMGDLGLSTATTAMPIMTIFMAIAMLIGNGGNALAALRMGEGSRVEAEKSLGNTVVLSIIVSALMAVLAFTPAIDGLLSLSSATAEDWDYAKLFIQTLSLGYVFQCIGMGVNNFIRTAGAPNRALLTMLVGAVACTAFNALFVLYLGWGVQGSALATICGEAISCACVLWFFIRTKDVPLKLHVHCMKLEGAVVKMILSLGAASFFVQAGMAIVNFVVNAMLVEYGSMSAIGSEGALASIGVVQSIAMFVVLPLIGVAIAIQPLLGFNYGAHNFDRVRKTFWWGVGAATVLSVLAWLLTHLLPNQIVGLFGISGDLLAFTVNAMQVQLFLLPLVGFQIVGSNYFQATGQPIKSVFLSLTRQILFLVPLYLLLPQMLPRIMPWLTSLDAVYYAVPCADFLAIFTTVLFVAWEMRRLKRLETGEIQARF